MAPPTPLADREAERRRVWAMKARETARERRKQRSAVLYRRQPAIEEAVRLFHVELGSRPTVDSVKLRTGLVYKHNDDPPPATDPAISPQRTLANPGALSAARRERLADRPPLGQLVNRRGAAIPLLITALGVAGIRHVEGERADLADIENVGKASWAKRIGDADPADIARRHVVDGVKRLRANDLVALRKTVGQGGGYSGWRLQSEDGSGGEYTVPSVPGLRVPVKFWSNGWAAALMPTEIATYLMVTYLAYAYVGMHNEAGVGIAPSARQQNFGISKEVYATLNELEEFGLVERTRARQTDPDAPREVDKFKLTRGGLDATAFDRISAALRKPVPLRLSRS